MKLNRLVVCLFFLLIAAAPLQAQDAVSDLLGRINSLRGSLGLPGYTLNASLSAAAQSQAQWMVDTGNVSHTRPDGSTPRTRAAAAGYGSNWVSENIYMGTVATASDAWNFWLNSAIHYAGMTSSNYSEIGIGAARNATWGAAYVLVFGNPRPLQQAVPRTGSSANGAAPAPPSFVVGVDQHGNIMHEIQPGDTLGDIALIYGYTWDDIPYMLQLNGMTDADIRELEVGSVFLVPPYDGTYTPTPDTQPTEAATPLPEMTTGPVELVALPTATATPPPSPQPSPTPLHIPIATSASVPQAFISALPSPTPLMVASAGTPALVASTLNTALVVAPDGPSPWLIVGIVLQVGVLAVAAVEFIRRARR